jgi:hypothetical protein
MQTLRVTLTHSTRGASNSRSREAYIYNVYGQNAAEEASESASSLRLHDNERDIIVFSDHPISGESFTESFVIDIPEYKELSLDRQCKTRKMHAILSALEMDYGSICFLDADTFVAHPIQDYFQSLNNFDIGLAHDSWRGSVEDCFHAPYNSGVIFIKNSTKTREMLTKWLANYVLSPYFPDQMTLYRTLNQSDLRIFPLPVEMNAKCVEPIFVSGVVRIVHAHYTTDVAKHPKVLANLINRYKSNRIFDISNMVMYLMSPDFKCLEHRLVLDDEAKAVIEPKS